MSVLRITFFVTTSLNSSGSIILVIECNTFLPAGSFSFYFLTSSVPMYFHDSKQGCVPLLHDIISSLDSTINAQAVSGTVFGLFCTADIATGFDPESRTTHCKVTPPRCTAERSGQTPTFTKDKRNHRVCACIRMKQKEKCMGRKKDGNQHQITHSKHFQFYQC